MTLETRETTKDAAPVTHSSRWAPGVALIGIGVLLLAGQFLKPLSIPTLILPGLALIFLVWGIATRTAGLMIPGGILAGLGGGTLLVTGPLAGQAEYAKGGAFLLCFAAGFALVTVLTAVFTRETHWWPLIPGSIMGLIGGALLVSNVAPQWLTVVGAIWPVILIVAGIVLVARYLKPRQQ